jgi:3-phenylpropionate/trans-cinnamate dioxygenase ferredoxin reductase component
VSSGQQVVIVGAGQAGIGAAAALRESGHLGPVTVIGREGHLPYERPPLSKAYLTADTVDESHLALRSAGWYAEHDIDLLLGQDVTGIDRDRHRVTLGSGEQLPYDHLILATGTRPRTLPLPGADLRGVGVLRDLRDARVLRGDLAAAGDVVAIGAGFIGMEFAAAAAKSGSRAVVLDVAPRVMGRAVATAISRHFTEAHRSWGNEILLECGVSELRGDHGRVTAVVASTGRVLPADTVVIAVGVAPNVELGADAGLDVGDGVIVDEYLRTSDPDVSAIGDCASFPEPTSGRRRRLESVQCAADHARCVAARLTGHPAPYSAVPWFWTHQGGLKLQIASLGDDADTEVVRGEPGTGRFSVFRYRGDRLLAVDSVNRPADHVAARRLLAADRHPTPEQIADPEFDLRTAATAPALPL